MSTTRLLRPSKPLNFHASSSSSSYPKIRRVAVKASFNGEKRVRSNNENGNNDYHRERKQMVAPLKALVAAATSSSGTAVITSKPLPLLLDLVSQFSGALLHILRNTFKRSALKLNFQMFIEKVITDCRFFTLFAVAGSLLASVLCFVEGCFLVIESYIQYFHTLAHRSTDHVDVVHLLIEAIDMFLVGMAMLVFGFGLYTMFVGSKSVKQKGSCLARSNFFGLFYMKKVPMWMEMQRVSDAKSKLGHAVMMILQVGVLEKLKNAPLVSPTDLACFAATVLVTSASVFLLSKLSLSPNKLLSEIKHN